MMQPHMAVAWSHGGAAQRGGGCKNPQSSFPATGGLGSAETMATFHTDEGFFFTAIAGVNQAGQGEMAATHAMPLLNRGEGGGGRTEHAGRKTNKAERLAFHLGRLLMKSAAPYFF